MKRSATNTKKSAAQPAPAKKSPSASSGSKSSSAMPEDMTKELQKLFEDEVRDIYWAEKALVKALPKMAKNASAPELKEALESHLEETKGHLERLDKVFESIGVKPQAKKCEAMAGLLKEGDEIMAETKKGMMRDAGIISAGQKVEHYEIATYGTLRAFAKKLGHEEAAQLLESTLEEEKAADEKLTEVTQMIVVVDVDGE